MWFFAIFLPPVYLFMKGRVIAGIINFFILAVGIVTTPVFGIGFFFIFCAIVQSLMTYKKTETTKVINQQAEAIASKMAEKLKSE
jgi:hypothetical protein